MTSHPWLALAGAIVLSAPPNIARSRLEWLFQQRLGPRNSGVATPPERRSLRLSARLALLGPIGAMVMVFGGAVAGSLAVLVGLSAIGFARSAERARIHADDEAALTHAVDALIEESRAGASLSQACGRAGRGGRFHAEFAAAERLAAAGRLVFFPELRHRHLASLTLACRVSAAVGVPLVRVLSGVASDLAADRRLRQAVSRCVSGAQSSALLLAGLPLVGLALGQAMGARPLTVLFRSDLGLIALAVGVCLDLAGVWWTRRLIDRVRP